MNALLCLVVLTWYPDSARLVATGLGGDLIGSATSARVSVRDSRGRLHVVFSKNWGSPIAESSDIFHTFSTDDGLSWSQPQAISRNGDTLSTKPALAIDSRDHLHCVWFECWGWSAPYFLFDYFYSEFDGSSWSVPQNISQRATYTNAIDHSAIAVDDWDRVHVAYEMAAGMGLPDVHYLYKEGAVWSATETVSNSTLDDGFPSIVSDAAGGVHLCWKQRGDSGRVFYAFRDTAWSGPEPIAAYRYGIDAPSLCASPDGHLHLVFAGWRSPSLGEVYYMQGEGDTWSAPFNVSGTSDTSSAGASVVADSAGRIHVAWSERPVGRMAQLFYRCRTDSWNDKSNLTSDTAFGSGSSRFSLQTRDGRPDLFWSGWDHAGLLGLFYMCLAPAQGLAGSRSQDTPWRCVSAAPNPFRVALGLAIAGSASQKVAVVVADAAGQTVRRLDVCETRGGLAATWDGRDDSGSAVPAGVYFVRSMRDGQSHEVKVVKLD